MVNKTLREFAQIHYGKSPNEIRVEESPFPIWGTGGKIGSALRPLFSGPIIILPRKGTLTNPSYCETDCWVIDTAYAAIAYPDVDTKWLFYNLSLANLESLNEATGVPSISRDMLYRLEFYALDFEEQQNIAEILTTVENLIEHTEAAIAKYQAIKQGMMHDLFTRGVDANGQLRPPHKEAPDLYKESELGWIPKEWEVKPLSSLTNLNRPIVYGILMPGYGYPGGVPVVKVKDIQDGEINESDILLTSPAIDCKYSKSKLWSGDILFSIRGTVGRTAIVPDSLDGANITQDTARISAPQASSIFIKEYLSTEYATRYTKVHTLGVAVQGINLRELREMPTLAPPPEEQAAIGLRIQTALDRIQKENAFLQKLKLKKSGLMQDLLSGRVRVPVNTPTDQEPRHAS